MLTDQKQYAEITKETGETTQPTLNSRQAQMLWEYALEASLGRPLRWRSLRSNYGTNMVSLKNVKVIPREYL